MIKTIKNKDLKRVRIDYDLTQSKMAAMLHCTTRAYQYYESQKREMPPALLELLSYKLLYESKYKCRLSEETSLKNKEKSTHNDDMSMQSPLENIYCQHEPEMNFALDPRPRYKKGYNPKCKKCGELYR